MNINLADKLYSENILSFGATFRAHRIAMKLSQKYVAKKIGCTQAAISMLERDICLPSISTLIGLMIILDIDPHEILIEP